MSSAPQLRGPWRPGQSGNPSGRPRLPDHLRAIKSLTQDEVTKIVSKFARMMPLELDAALQAGNLSVIEMAIAQMFGMAIAKADWQRLAFLLDRAIGKLVIEPVGEDLAALREIQELTDEELRARVLEAARA